MEETWKEIKGYEGYYAISNLGRIKSLERVQRNGHRCQEKILLLRPNKTNGHIQILLHKDMTYKMFYLKRLVAEHFVDNPNPTEFKQVRQIDGDKTNCKSDNLEWVDKVAKIARKRIIDWDYHYYG